MAKKTDNLKPQSKRTKAEQREIASKGGKASGEARRQRRALRECLEAILEKPTTDEELIALLTASKVANTYDNAMALALIRKALSGDPKAFEVVRDTIGQKPMDKVEHSGGVEIMTDADRALLEKVARRLNG